MIFFSEEGGGFGPGFTKDFFESTHLNKGKGDLTPMQWWNLKRKLSGFFDENFPGEAADLSFKDHSFSNHGTVFSKCGFF